MQKRYETILDSVYNGQWKQAKEQTQSQCKTKPSMQAFIVGQVTLLLHLDEEEPELAITYLCLFRPSK